MRIPGKAMRRLWRPAVRPKEGRQQIQETNPMFRRSDLLIVVLWCVIIAALWAGSSTNTPPVQFQPAGEMDREDPAREEMLRKLRGE